MATEVKVPDIGDFEEVPVIEILVSEGDEVTEEQALVTLESDKATMDVPSPAAGTVKEILVSVNDKVSEGSALLTLDDGGGNGDDAEADGADAPEEAEEDVPSQDSTGGEEEDVPSGEESADDESESTGSGSDAEATDGPAKD